jgi:polysaccharide pyruvyl transferase WcaK-like protein
MAARQGLETSILGFSVNDSPDDAAIADLAALSHRVRLCVRDPVSLGRLASRGIGNLIRVADLAFLMPPAGHSFATERAERWIEAQRSAGRSVLVFNLSTQALTEAGRLGKAVLQQLADLIETLISTRRSSVLFLPHDLRAHGTAKESDVAIAVALSRLVSKKLVDHRYHAVAVPTSAAEAKRLAGLADWVVTGRMHLAIAAWGMGKPVIGISYQGKFEGLAQDLGMSSCLVDSRTFDVQRLADTCLGMLKQIEEVAAAVRARLPHVVEMAGMNLSVWPDDAVQPRAAVSGFDAYLAGG